MALVRKEFKAKDTVCESCAEVIRRAAMKVDGVTEASFNYAAEKGHIVFDDSKASTEQIFRNIEEKGYPCSLIEESHASDPGELAKGSRPDEAETPETNKPKKSTKGKVCGPDCDCCADEGDEEKPAESPAVTIPNVKPQVVESRIHDIAKKETAESKPDEVVDNDDEADEVKTKRSGQNSMFGIGIIAIGLIVLAYFMLPMIGGIEIPEFTSTMGLGLIFVAGLLTGFHCISMCGSFVLSYTAKDAQSGVRSKKSHLFYGAGKTLSYTIIGGIFGFVGSIIAFTPAMRGAAAIIAGIFLVIYGLKMLNVHPIFRKFTIRTPKTLAKFVHKEEKEHSNPLLIGLLNGLMIACGPLQAMYIMAAGTGNPIQGATMLLVFGLGTLPAMLGFGYFASAISGKMTHKILKASGVVVMILGIFMLNNGLALTGSGYDFGTMAASIGIGVPAGAQANTVNFVGGYQTIVMNVTSSGWSPSTFVLKKGVPVKWIINGIQLNGCNSGVQVPKLNMKFQVKQGEQTIEFTPTTEGTIPFSCWMGMIQGRFIVKADIDTTNTTAVQQVVAATPKTTSSGMTCGGSSGGGCGCGGAAAK